MLKVRGVVGFAFLLVCGAAASAAEPEIRIVGDPSRPKAIEIMGLPKQQLAEFAKLAADDPAWSKALAVYVAEGPLTADSVAILGSYAVDGSALRFTPRYSLRPGLKYRIVFRPADGAASSEREFTKEITVPTAPLGAPTKVTAIYPSAAALPENLLRFYVHFSAPMSAGEAYGRVKLLKADGTPVNRAFLEIGEELWDGAGQRLTLLFDPGRVKKGLKPREEFGPVLEAGQNYRLVVDKAWHDANGQPLAELFEKRFTAGPAVETAVDWKQWKLNPAAAGTRDPLVVRFPRPLDRALLMRMVTVRDAREKLVAGQIKIGEEERRWEFRPDEPWKAQSFALVVDTALEDSAGNNLARPFEVDVFDRVDEKTDPEFVRIPFVVTPSQRK